jgi:hypothetical protein
VIASGVDRPAAQTARAANGEAVLEHLDVGAEAGEALHHRR